MPSRAALNHLETLLLDKNELTSLGILHRLRLPRVRTISVRGNWLEALNRSDLNECCASVERLHVDGNRAEWRVGQGAFDNLTRLTRFTCERSRLQLATFSVRF